MNGKKYFAGAIALNVALLSFAVCLSHNLAEQTDTNEHEAMTLRGASGKFGPMMEIVLRAAKTDSPPEITNLETGRPLVQPSTESFNSRADAIMGWILSHGLDISCNVWSGGAACVTYDMTVVPVESKYWEKSTEDELLGNRELAPVSHAPRRLLVLGHDRPDTYMFRTGEGTLGMLRIVGLSEHGNGVKIRYKLINPAGLLSFVNSRKRS
jgi:hypothetical protein